MLTKVDENMSIALQLYYDFLFQLLVYEMEHEIPSREKISSIFSKQRPRLSSTNGISTRLAPNRQLLLQSLQFLYRQHFLFRPEQLP